MELTKTETRILKHLIKTDEISQSKLGSELNIKKSNLSTYLKKLNSAGLVTVKKSGREKTINISQVLYSEYTKIQNENIGRILFDSIAGETPYLISYFFGKEFKIKDLGLPEATSKRTLKKLRNLGIVFMRKKGIYKIREEMKPLSEFCNSFLYLINLETIKKEFDIIHNLYISKSPTKWDLLFGGVSDSPSKRYFLTAFSVFHKFGIRLILTSVKYYTTIKPKLHNIIIHALAFSVSEARTIKDTRRLCYSCAFILKNKISYKQLMKVEHKFGIAEDFLKKLFQFINSKGKKTYEGFPSWGEVEGVLYGKTV